MSCIIWVNSCTRNKINFSKDNIARGLCTLVLFINIVFDEIYGIDGRDPCPTDYVEVIDGVGEGEPSLGKFCFVGAPEPILTSSEKATVVFQASSFRRRPSRVGVSISYTAISNGKKKRTILSKFPTIKHTGF